LSTWCCVGGTFDHLHNGHKILLTVSALLASSSLVVGMTDPSMLTKKSNGAEMEPFAERQAILQWWIKFIQPTITCEIVPIHGYYLHFDQSLLLPPLKLRDSFVTRLVFY
jgi:phosphopantetheine adenylyltransferase